MEAPKLTLAEGTCQLVQRIIQFTLSCAQTTTICSTLTVLSQSLPITLDETNLFLQSGIETCICDVHASNSGG